MRDLETLGGDQLTSQKQRTDVMKITAIQDFTDPDGFVNFTWDNDLDPGRVHVAAQRGHRPDHRRDRGSPRRRNRRRREHPPYHVG